MNNLLQQRTASQRAQPLTPQATTSRATPQATTSQATPLAASQTAPQPQGITERTALRYMEQLGFQFKTFRQGIQYTDGHEREDVVKYRKTYLNKMKFLESIHKPPPTCDDGILSWHSGKETATRNVVFIYHDETIFFANDAPSQGWHDDMGSRQLRPKGRGKGLMISDFVEEYNGFLSLTDEELQRAQQCDPAFPQSAREIFIFGKGYDGYWNNELLMENLKKAVKIAEFKYTR